MPVFVSFGENLICQNSALGLVDSSSTTQAGLSSSLNWGILLLNRLGELPVIRHSRRLRWRQGSTRSQRIISSSIARRAIRLRVFVLSVCLPQALLASRIAEGMVSSTS